MTNTSSANRTVVVIDHHGAHIYKHVDDAGGETEKTVKPYDPHGFHHHLIHKKEAHYSGERTPEESSFYEAVAGQLRSASEIVLIGHGTGKSSAVDHLQAFLKEKHHDVAARVVATEHADLSAMTEPQLEALARKHLTAK